MINDNMQCYAVQSLELHLFFARIMKEHSLFLKAGFTPVSRSFFARADMYKREFENILSRAVSIADGFIGERVICSGEIVTGFTAEAERQTERLTGISINKGITERELRLKDGGRRMSGEYRRVKALNASALKLLDGLIEFKEDILEEVLSCRIFTANYPLLLEHILREAKLYREHLQTLEREGCISCEQMRSTECFWDRIMMEHALFMRGLFDPSEEKLIETADTFAKEYELLLKNCRGSQNKAYSDTLEETKKFRDFKIAGVKGIEECKIRSLILPLLADHVLREANHFIRVLEDG